MIQPLLIFSDWAIFVARVVLGLILVRHGLPKLKNPKGTGVWLEGVGFRPGIFWGLVAGLLEFVGGLALVFGFLTQLASFFIVLQFLVILFKFKNKAMFEKDAEIDWLILTLALLILTLGSGALSVDEFFGLILY